MGQPRGSVSGGTVDNSGLIPFEQSYFAFEVESPVGTLKEVPIWDEVEQMLDNPYGFALAPEVGGNLQGWPSYRSTLPRRRSFIYRNAAGQPCAPGSAGCTERPLAGHVVHPLNYNFQSGEELRLLNINFEGVADWPVPLPCVDPVTNEWTCTTSGTNPDGTPIYEYDYTSIEVSPGEDRIEEDEAEVDYNSPINPNAPATACIVTVEPIPPPEGATLCGGDTGEPGYLGFGRLGLTPRARARQYSVPAVPFGTAASTDPNSAKGSIVGLPLYDPVRGLILPRPAISPIGGLRRPSLRAEGQPGIGVHATGRVHHGNPANPDYLHNSAADLAEDPDDLLPSNENDYYRGITRAQKVNARNEAAALGKALFWDMQVGSDSVQACGSCHFHAGVDNRTKGQINSNTAGNDLTSITVANTINGTADGANAEVTVDSFPLHKLQDPLTPADPLNLNGNAILRTTNDVLSSMGVSRFKLFGDVPVGLAAFLPAGSGGVRSLRSDYACGDSTAPSPNIASCAAPPDPVPVNHGFRRVEPRHTPTFFAATMNFDNFWDGRARHDFNGGSVFGAADPQAHVMVHDPDTGDIVPTRQVIRFVSLSSLATGPALSEFEMSFAGRNWAKLGKRLLQNGVTPLANQLVSTSDSLLGRYSNQGGSACSGVALVDRSPGTPAPGKPGLCINYRGLIKRSFYDNLWVNTSKHLNGCYTDAEPFKSLKLQLHSNQCDPSAVKIPVLADGAVNWDNPIDPFDNYVLSVASGAAAANDTNQFTHMEANFSLFFGLSVHAWVGMLLPDDTPFDRFMDDNPDSFVTFGEANETALVLDLLSCQQTGGVKPCFTEVGNFKRDASLIAKIDCPGPEGTAGCTFTPTGGTRAGGVDPLLGLDFFLGSNLSLKNPGFNTLRCGECHAGGTFTDHTVEISHQLSFNDWAQEFAVGTPGIEIFPEPLGRGRVISGFALEGELNGNAQDAVERNAADFCTIEPCEDVYGNPVPGGVTGGFPQGQALFDNGMYNIGVTPIADDTSRGGLDAFGWPLSLARLALKNICGLDYTPGGDDPDDGFAQPGSAGSEGGGGGNVGNVCPTFDPSIDPTGGGVFEETAQDQGINPGFAEELPEDLAQLPAYLAPWASNINVGDETQVDEVFIGLNTVMKEPMLEGFIDSFGPFNPAAILGEMMNNAVGDQMATWPNVNRVNVQGAFKAPPLRNVELSNPFFHDGGNLTLRQQLDFYTRGGNFPLTNKAHRDFLVMNLMEEDEALGVHVVPSATCDPTAPLGSRGRTECVGVAPDTAGSVPLFSPQQKEEIIVSVVDFLLELTDERVAFERAPFDHPEIFVSLDATAPENGVLNGTPGNRAGFLANLAGVCKDSAGNPFPGATSPCFQQVLASGQGGIAAKLPNFLNISSGPRLVGAAANCPTVNNHYCH
jgi:cytochrome c peroxidase